MDISEKPKSRQELASEYNVNIRTFMKWLEKEGITLKPGLIYPKKVKEIYKRFGYPPGNIDNDEYDAT